jgi:hypothetical protein
VRRQVAQEYLHNIQSTTGAKEAWAVLAMLHTTSLGAKKSLLEDQLTDLAKETSKDIAAYCGGAHKLSLQLIATGEACSDDRLIRAIFTGLPAESSNVLEVLMYQTSLTVDTLASCQGENILSGEGYSTKGTYIDQAGQGHEQSRVLWLWKDGSYSVRLQIKGGQQGDLR